MERACMTPDQFFDHLDILFGSDDGYIPHLERIRALIEENKKIKEENEELKHDKGVLEARNEELEEHITDLQQVHDDLEEENEKLEYKNKKLKEENKKLKEEIKEYEIESNESGVQEQKLYRQLFQFEAENEKLQEENKELKEENKKLKETKLSKFQCDRCKGHHTGCANPTCDSCVKEIEEEWLKKGIENDPEQYGEAMARENFKSEEEYQDWLKNSPKLGVDY